MADFYERNPQARDLGNRSSPSKLLDGRSREDILRNAFYQMKTMRAWRGRDLWSWIGAVTGHGSGYSMQICEELGWDAHMRMGLLDRDKESPSETDLCFRPNLYQRGSKASHA